MCSSLSQNLHQQINQFIPIHQYQNKIKTLNVIIESFFNLVFFILLNQTTKYYQYFIFFSLWLL